MTTTLRILPLTTSNSMILLFGGVTLLILILQASPAHTLIGVSLITLILAGLDWGLTQHFGEKLPVGVAIVSIVIHTALIELMTLLDGLTYTSVLYLTLPFPVFFRLGRWAGVVISSGLFLWFTLKFSLFKPGWSTDPTMLNTYMLFLVALILITAMALLIQRERANRQRAERLLKELEISHAQLAQYTEQVAELATIEERNRLARDIHDSLGHYLTVIGIQLEKAAVVYVDHPDLSLEAIRVAKRMTDQALQEVRQSVGLLRREQALFRLQTAIDDLIANMVGLPFTVTFQNSGDEAYEAYYSKQQILTLYRAVQEALTNIQKHAQAKQVTLQLHFGEHEVTLNIFDDGVGIVSDPLKTTGFGLRGIKERLSLINGQLQIVSKPTYGTQLAITIPRVSF